MSSTAFRPYGKRLVTASNDKTAQAWTVCASVQALADRTRAIILRCLMIAQRQEFLLTPAPPHWCITGPGRELETDPENWQGKWPYDTEEWRAWLAERLAGGNPPLPGIEEIQ